MPFVFTLIQRVKTGLYGKSNSETFMYRWFVYDSTEQWIVPRQGHFIFVIFVLCFVPITAGLRCDGHLLETLFMVCPTYCSWHITQVATQIPWFAHIKFWLSGKDLLQWSSTWAKSPPRGRFHALWGRFCDLRDLGGDFGFQGGDFCRWKHAQMLNWFQKNQYLLLWNQSLWCTFDSMVRNKAYKT